jgi:tetratricopeptide (TPR) repeat protein
LSGDPDNQRAFWGLVQTLSMSEEYQGRLLALLKERVERSPDDSRAKMELANLLARVGEVERAHELWMETLQIEPVDPSRYSEVGALEIRNKMYEQALDTFLKGRARFPNPSIFSQELTQVYALMGDFDRAIDECILTVESHSGAVPWATNRIEMMLAAEADRRGVERRMMTVLRKEDASEAALSLAGSVLLVLGKPDQALQAYLRADELAGSLGVELIEFCQTLEDQGLDKEAREAYLMVIERHPGTASAARAGMGAARILARLGHPEEATAELRGVADEYAGSSVGARALYECAEMELDELNRPEDALETVRDLRARFGNRVDPMADDAAMIEVEANVRLERYDEAYAQCQELTAKEVPDRVREAAMFNLGFVSLLRHDADDAMEKFRDMVKENPSGRLVNDALRFMLVIALADEAQNLESVELLADAYAARLKGDLKTSERLLTEVAGAPASEALEAEALLLLGTLASDRGDDKDAIGYYDRIILGTEGVAARAEAMMRKGDLLAEDMGQKAKALDAYGGILELPLNPLSGEARRKIDRLRRGEGVAG